MVYRNEYGRLRRKYPADNTAPFFIEKWWLDPKYGITRLTADTFMSKVKPANQEKTWVIMVVRTPLGSPSREF